MKILFLITTVLLILHDSNSYILLTANMEDVNALAKQLATSPVADQISKLWRRAANQFQNEIKRDTRRADDSDDEDTDNDVTRNLVKNIITIGKSTGYLGPIKRAFEFIDEKM